MTSTRRFFHRTTAANARAIVVGGFTNSTGAYMTDEPHAGVWLSDRPLDTNDGAVGDVLLVIELDANVVERYEWVEPGKTYREVLVLASIINAHAVVRPARADEQATPC